MLGRYIGDKIKKKIFIVKGISEKDGFVEIFKDIPGGWQIYEDLSKNGDKIENIGNPIRHQLDGQ